LLPVVLVFSGCGKPKKFIDNPETSNSHLHTTNESAISHHEISIDTVYVSGQSVIFYAPSAEELGKLTIDNATREGLRQAIGDFAYYASIVTDSLQSENFSVLFTEKPHILLGQGQNFHHFDRNHNHSPLGLILFNGEDQPKILPGMQTHLSVLSAVENYFYIKATNSVPLLDYFKEVDTDNLHVYSSHSDILNQTGQRINPAHHMKFGSKLSSRADKYHMSVYAYHKFALQDSITAIICRVPSRYDESSIRLYIWDQQTETTIAQIELAENVWNEKWIMVKDSWLSLTPDRQKFSLIQRKKEARMNQGQRIETDSLYQWRWTGSGFERMSVSQLSIQDYPLQDWESYQEPAAPSEITIIDEDYVWLPLETGDLTWENIILQLPKPFSIEKEPIENNLLQGQFDTLVTVSHKSLNFKFYRSPIGTLIISGKVSTPAIQFKNGLGVGLSKEELAPIFVRLNTGTVIPDIVRIRSKEGDRTISCYFENDSLSLIELTNYIH
jgi:hypothetical protein